MWLKIGCLRRPKHEISPNHLPWKLALAVSCARQWAFKWLLDSETCRMIYFWRSANPDLDPTEDTGGLVPVTSLLVGDQDKRLLSEAANASTRPADLIEIVKRAPIGR
ncbi:MAG: hypothetical protein KAX89_08010 [Propionivibrio sp.]|nr:hypothetical protein [Propionivibrio sp.]